MNKIRNVFIKQHQRERWRYLSLFEPICWRTLPSVCLISLKNTLKTHRTLIPRGKRPRLCLSAKIAVKKSKGF